MQKEPVQPIVSADKPRRARLPLNRANRWKAEHEAEAKACVQVFVTQTAYQAITKHANSDLDNEVGGWLAGRWCQDPEGGGEFIVVEALLPAQQVRSGSTFLTFTHDSQVAMLAALEERYANKGIVGWYHTHPRMGVFLSGYDLWLHDHFFPYPWQVALVVEPHSHTAGFFIRDGQHHLDGRRFYGFYELQNRKAGTVVDWKNMKADIMEAAPAELNPARPTKPAVLNSGDTRPVQVETKLENKPMVHARENKPTVHPAENGKSQPNKNTPGGDTKPPEEAAS